MIAVLAGLGRDGCREEAEGKVAGGAYLSVGVLRCPGVERIVHEIQEVVDQDRSASFADRIGIETRCLASAAHRRHQLHGNRIERVHDDVGECERVLRWRKGRIGHSEHTQSGGSG